MQIALHIYIQICLQLQFLSTKQQKTLYKFKMCAHIFNNLGGLIKNFQLT